MEWTTESMTYQEMMEYCIWPSWSQAQIYFILGLCYSFLQRLCSLKVMSNDLKCWMLAALGIFMLAILFPFLLLFHILFLVMGTYGLLYGLTKLQAPYRGPTLVVTLLSFMVINEMKFDQEDWRQIRGIEMLVIMKGISLSGTIPTLYSFPNISLYLGYVLCPGTLLFGPWVSWNAYLKSLEYPVMDKEWFKTVSIRCFKMFFFFFLSSCVIDYIFSGIPTNEYLLMYKDALNYRTSHYFISYFSETTFIMAGFGLMDDRSWSSPVTYVQYIELPRSLVQVVIYWNIPMHVWLKNFIFRRSSPYGKFISVALTYFVSSLLHGLNYRLAAVLMSLGFYTYIEYILRAELSKKWKACIGARSCNEPCSQHRHTENNLSVKMFNLCWSFLTIFHLAYLGCLMDTSDDSYNANFSESFKKWKDLDFVSHWIVLFTYLLYFVFKIFHVI